VEVKLFGRKCGTCGKAGRMPELVKKKENTS
jgi:hypothetical protein